MNFNQLVFNGVCCVMQIWYKIQEIW
uniref:Uncharacterized protein n=1 Tax=Tetranychus urticae TaxID=32264 RepID=T1KB22_TETUR